MQNEENTFRTQKGYDLTNKASITRAMEDYLEMITRLSAQHTFIRVTELAEMLHVRTSSASKMVSNLKSASLVDYEKYGLITLTDKGKQLGKYLLHRHQVLNRFFCLINHSESELEQVEQIEHYINQKTVENIEQLLALLERKERKP